MAKPDEFGEPTCTCRDLTNSVLTALSDSGVAPSRLELEIAEGGRLRDSEATLATLYMLRSYVLGLPAAGLAIALAAH
jgi:EAL domain-containing protein (putative c-di-GMP-specific phosphodiesterase class I)